MQTSFRRYSMMIAALLAACTAVSAEPLTPTPASRQAQKELDRQGSVFIENRGQWDRQVKFLMRSGGMDMWITDRGVRYDLFKLARIEKQGNPTTAHAATAAKQPTLMRSGHVVGVSFEGASFAPSARGIRQQPGANNYFIGNNPSKWASGVRLFAEARIDGLYDGIDAIFYLDGGRPRYDLIVAAGADPQQVRMKIEGSNGVGLGADGSLAIATTMGTLEQRGLYAYQEVGGQRQQVACRFVVTGDQRVSFELGSYDRSRALVIDPLVYSTYLGGNSGEEAQGMAMDGSGNVYVTGLTFSTDFPILNQYQTVQADADAFVTKLVHSGTGNVSLAYSTFLGGKGSDEGRGIAVDSSGNAYVTGETFSDDFPAVDQYQSVVGEGDIFVTKLAYSGSGSVSVAYSTYVGGGSNEYGNSIAVDTSGNVYVTGESSSEELPLVNEYQTFQFNIDVFVMKLAYNTTDGVSLVYSTFLGGASDEEGTGIAVDKGGNAYVVGYTGSTDFPVLNQYQTNQSGYDVFVTKLAYGGTGKVSLVYSTYLGGNNIDFGNAIAIDGNGSAYITGLAVSTDFPTLKQYQTVQTGGDGFVTRLDYAGTGSVMLGYSTYLGGNSIDQGTSIALDPSGKVYITGFTLSTDFPLLKEFQNHPQDYDAFVTKLEVGNSGNVSLVYSTYLGGNGRDEGAVIAVTRGGNACVVGNTESTDFPLLNEVRSDQPTMDGFVTMIGLSPAAHVQTERADGNGASINLALTPNPVRDNMQVSFTLRAAMTVKLEIYTTDGRLVSARVDKVEPGSHSENIIVDGLPAGVYTLRVLAGASSFVEQFVVVR